MKKRCVSPFLVLLESAGLLNAITIPCNETYPTANGKFCYPCSRGFKKFSDCVQNYEQARCVKCNAGEYQSDCDNSTKCVVCSPHCPPGQEKIKQCTDVSDMECRCKDGKFWVQHKEKTDEGYCKPHSRCKEGEGLEERGTPFKDTKCTPCQEGTFSNSDSFDGCVACSICNIFYTKNCSLTHDAECGTSTPSSTEIPQSQSGAGKIAGITLSVVFVIVVSGLAIFYLYRRSKHGESGIEQTGQTCLQVCGRQVCQEIDMERGGQIVQANPISRSHLSPNGTIPGKSGDSDAPSNVELPDRDKTGKTETRNGGFADQSRTGEQQQNSGFEMTGNTNNDLRSSNDSDEDTTDLSTDAGPVPPRSLQSSRNEDQIEHNTAFQRAETGYENVTDSKVETLRNEDSCLNTMMHTRNSVQIDLTEKDWLGIFQFLSSNLKFDEFKAFYRWLLELSDSELKTTKDAVIDQAEKESNCQECIYQLMRQWKLSMFELKQEFILEALKKLHLNETHGKLVKLIKRFYVKHASEVAKRDEIPGLWMEEPKEN